MHGSQFAKAWDYQYFLHVTLCVCFRAPTACFGFCEPNFSALPSPAHPVPPAASPPFQGITILHCCTNSGVETKVRWRGSSMKRKNSNQLSFSKKYIFRVPCRRFSGSGLYRKPVTSQLHVNTTQWQHEKEQYFLHCFFLLACSLFTKCHPTMKTADQRNQVLTGLKIKINATLVPYPSSYTQLNICNITTFQWFSYILNFNSIMPSLNRQMMWPLTATPTTKNQYILYQSTLFLPFQNYLSLPHSHLLNHHVY